MDKIDIAGSRILDQAGSEGVRTAFELMQLVDFLGESIIERDYSPSSELTAAICLNDRGSRAVRAVSIELNASSRKQQPARGGQAKKFTSEVHLMCLLELGNGQPLIDLERTDPNAVASAISKEVQAGKIRHPYIFGGVLYRRACEILPDLVREISHQKTLDLLEGAPQGVFQVGQWVVGPEGLDRVAHERWMPPTVRVPLQHCSDLACNAVHFVRLSTAASAPINAYRENLQRYISKEFQEVWDWGDAFSLEFGETPGYYDEERFPALLPLIGDGLVDGEVRALLCELIEKGQAEFRSASPRGSRVKSVHDYVESLSIPGCLQDILWFSDSDIVRALDRLVLSAPPKIRVPGAEIRSPVLAKAHGAGYFGLTTEIGSRGVRSRASRDISTLRLDRLIRLRYAGDESTSDATWKLRGFDGATPREKIDSAVRRGDLLTLVDDLLLDTRGHALDVCGRVGLSSEFADRRDLASLVAWKLGFDSNEGGDAYEEFVQQDSRFGAEISSATRSFSLSGEWGGGDHIRSVRETSVSYFVSLERVLKESLAFTGWALLYDHYSDARPFMFDIEDALRFTVEWLERHGYAGDKIDCQRPTLKPLMDGLFHLGKILRGRADGVAAPFPEDRRPEVAGKSELILFPFSSTTVFDSLTEESKRAVIEKIVEAGRSLLDSDICGHRNRNLHYRPQSLDVSNLAKSVSTVSSTVRSMDEFGIIPAVYSLSEVRRSRWGRRSFRLSVRGRRSVEILSPTPYLTAPMPGLHEEQLLLPYAKVNEDGLVPRFVACTDSEYSRLWRDIPVRRRKSVRRIDPGLDSEIGGTDSISE